jgi:hypothetical protein
MTNNLPVSAARWQLGSLICFCNFYIVKNDKTDDNSITTEAREKNTLNPLNFISVMVYVWLHLKANKFYSVN